MNMYDMDRQVLETAGRWAGEGYRFALITVVRTWGSAPRPPGSWMALREDGQVAGSVSGGCIEDDLVDKMRGGAMRSALPFLLTYGVTQDEARRYGLPCGGTMELMVEPRPDLPSLETLKSWLSDGHLVRRTVVVGEQEVRLEPVVHTEALSFDGKRLAIVRGPQWRLLIIGAGQIAEYLAPMAQALGYRVFVCDPRTEYSAQWRVPGASLLSGMPDDVAIELRLDPHTAVVATTHDPKLDDMALLEALKSPAFYVGALGSRVNSERRKERLLEHFALSYDQVERLYGPVGLPIGSNTPPEIAIAILAEMTAVKNGMWTKSADRFICMEKMGSVAQIRKR
jgi:xanthine dehydrogenase accessory factor